MKWFGKIFDLLTGNIASSLADAYKARQEAKTDQGRIDADERVKTLTAQAKTHGRIESIIRAAIFFPFIIYIWKLVLYDKIWELGVTDDLSPDLWFVFKMGLGFYFVRWTILPGASK